MHSAFARGVVESVESGGLGVPHFRTNEQEPTILWDRRANGEQGYSSMPRAS